MLPKVSMVVRTMPRTNWDTKFWTWVMSLVTRVTREPVLKASIWGKEKDIIRRKQSFRMLLPMFWPAMWTNTLLREPHSPPNSTSRIIRRPSCQMRAMLPTPPFSRPRTPSSTIRLMIPGWVRSMDTSPTMKRAAKTA